MGCLNRLEVFLQEFFARIAVAWPVVEDLLLGPGLTIAIAVGSALVLVWILRLVTRGLSKTKVKKKVRDIEDYRQRRNRVIHAVKVVLGTVFWTVAGTIVLTQVRRLLAYTESEQAVEFGTWLMGPGLRVAVYMVGTGLLAWLVNFFTHKVVKIEAAEETVEGEEKAQRQQTILHSLRVLVTVIIWVLGGLMILTELGVKVGAIIAGLGVVGIAVGFGAQNLIRDILGGIFLIIEDQIRLGDVVRIGDAKGTVEKMTLRVTVIRGLNGYLFTIPNGEIKIVENMTRDWSRAVVKIGVGYNAKIDDVIEALREAMDDLKADESLSKYIMEEPQIKAINDFADSSLEVAAWIKCNPGQQWELGRKARRYIKTRFDEAGIEIPFPQITLTLGQGEAELLAAFKRGKQPKPGKKSN